MKQFLLLGAWLAVFPVLAQTAPTAPAQPAQPPQPAQPMQPPQPRMQPSPSPTSPMVQRPPPNNFVTNQAAANALNPNFNAGNLNNLTPADVSVRLVNLQSEIEQTLPVLFALVRGVNVHAAAAAQQPGAANRARVATTPGNPNQSTQFQSLPPTGNPNAPAQAQTRVPSQRFIGVFGTNVVSMDTITIQQLVALENDLRQALPLLQALNGVVDLNQTGLNPGVTGSAFTGTSFTNRVVIVPGATAPGGVNHLTNGPGTLLPTGR